MSVKLIKVKSEPCLKCGSVDFKVVGSSIACAECFTYVFKKLVRKESK